MFFQAVKRNGQKLGTRIPRVSRFVFDVVHLLVGEGFV